MSWEYVRKVKYYETDRMGVVHHSNYLRLIEDARMEWLRDNLICYSELESMGVIIPAVSASGDFINFLRFDDEFKITVKLTEVKGIKMFFEYEVIKTSDNSLCYKGISSHCFVTDGSYKPCLSFRKNFPELYKKLLTLVEKN